MNFPHQQYDAWKTTQPDRPDSDECEVCGSPTEGMGEEINWFGSMILVCTACEMIHNQLFDPDESRAESLKKIDEFNQQARRSK